MRKWNELEFEWDEEKAAANLKKHGIDFRDAALVFNDPFRKEFYDAAHSGGEDRYNTIGKVDEILFVVYTELGIRTRIISARPANKKEMKIYYDCDVYDY